MQLEECNGFPRLSWHDLQLLSDTKRLFVLDSRAPIKIQQQTGSARIEGSYLFSAHAVMWLQAIWITCSTSTPNTLSPAFLSSPPPFLHMFNLFPLPPPSPSSPLLPSPSLSDLSQSGHTIFATANAAPTLPLLLQVGESIPQQRGWELTGWGEWR